jgi:putative transposase
MKAQAFAYRRRHGHYPAVVCADQIYRTRSNRAFCARHKILMGGPRLGRPKSDPVLVAEEKRQFIDDQRRRNAVEGKFGQGKHRFGFYLIREKLELTQQIIRKLKTAEQLIAQGKTVADVCRVIEVTQPTYHRWRQQYGGMQAEEARRLTQLEKENSRLKKLLAEAELEKAMLKDLVAP